MAITRVDNELAWIPELELTIEFAGKWEYRVVPPPPFPLLSARALTVPVELEAYALEPRDHNAAEAVAWDLVHGRLADIEEETYEIGRGGPLVKVVAVGKLDLPKPPKSEDAEADPSHNPHRFELAGYVYKAYDLFFVLDFVGPVGLVERFGSEIDTMVRSTTFGAHRGHGRGVTGLLNILADKASESPVKPGRSRGQWSSNAMQRVRMDRQKVKAGISKPPVCAEPQYDEPMAPDLLNEFDHQLSTFEELEPTTVEPLDPLALDVLADDFDGFDSKLLEAKEQAPAIPPMRWPRPWQSLPSVAPQRTPSDLGMRLAPSFKAVSVGRRELELLGHVNALPAEIAYYGEKVAGVVEQVGHRADEPFSVVGLDQVALLLEGVLRIRQGEEQLEEIIEVGLPRRAISPLGRQIPDGSGLSLGQVLAAAAHDDDDTAGDMLGWHLGWKDVQERMASFGLSRHSILIPARARALAFTTTLAGPLTDLSLEQRIELWRSATEAERRSLIGQIHTANLDTDLASLTEEFLDVAEDASVSWESKARWALALGPRGCAAEYGGLFASLFRGKVLSAAHSAMAVDLLKPCAGDHLTGAGRGDFLQFGKLGQTFGALCGVGVVGKSGAAEVAVCILAKNVQTDDHADLAEQIRKLGALITTMLRNA